MSNKRYIGGKKFFEMLGATDAREGNRMRTIALADTIYKERLKVWNSLPEVWASEAYDKGYKNQCVSQEPSLPDYPTHAETKAMLFGDFY